MMEEGSYMPRPWALPQLPWGTLHNPRYVQTKQGEVITRLQPTHSGTHMHMHMHIHM